MLNWIWAVMVVGGVVYGFLTGNVEAVGNACLESAKEAVTLCITMLGVMGFWCGCMEIASRAGLIESLTRKMRPFVRWMFPNLPLEHPAAAHITMNMIANILGLGWAATPAGLRAMEELGNLEEERRKGRLPGTNRKQGTASDEMCTFLILNISSLQLIPVNVIAYRSQYGSVNPAAVVFPAMIATAVSTLAGVAVCKVIGRISVKRQEKFYKY